MTKLRYLAFLVGFTLLVSMILISNPPALAASALEAHGLEVQQSNQGAQQQTERPVSQPNRVQVFKGKILERAGAYILFDSANKTKYNLDNQHEAKGFKNKVVQVTGTLDPASNTIHVNNIQPAS